MNVKEFWPPPSVRGGQIETSIPGGIDASNVDPKAPPAQAEFPRVPRAVRVAKLGLLREAVHELCAFIKLHADTCQNLAEAGDDAGMLHSLARLITYTKEAARTGCALRAIRDGKEGAP